LLGSGHSGHSGFQLYHYTCEGIAAPWKQRGLLQKLGNILGNFENMNSKTLAAQGFHRTIQRTPPPPDQSSKTYQKVLKAQQMLGFFMPERPRVFYIVIAIRPKAG